MARRMVRRRAKGTGYKAASDPDAEPDLHSMPFVDGASDREGASSSLASVDVKPIESVSYAHAAGFSSAQVTVLLSA